MWICLMPPNQILKNGEDGRYYVVCFTGKKNVWDTQRWFKLRDLGTFKPTREIYEDRTSRAMCMQKEVTPASWWGGLDSLTRKHLQQDSPCSALCSILGKLGQRGQHPVSHGRFCLGTWHTSFPSQSHRHGCLGDSTFPYLILGLPSALRMPQGLVVRHSLWARSCCEFHIIWCDLIHLTNQQGK